MRGTYYLLSRFVRLTASAGGGLMYCGHILVVMTTPALTEPLRETLDAFEREGAPLTTSEVTAQVDVSRRSTYERLERLVERGYLETKKVGASARVWWLATPAPDRAGGTAATVRSGDPARRQGAAQASTDPFVRGLLETQRDIVYAFDADGQLCRWNDRLEEVTGYTAAEIRSMEALSFVPDSATEEAAAVVERVLEDGERLTVELPLETADGERLPYEYSIAPMTDPDGTITGVTGIARGVSDRNAREHERELERYETLFEESKDVNVVVDETGEFNYLTPSVATVFGYDQEELVGEVGFEYVHPDDREEAMAEFTKMLETPGYEAETEFRFRHGDGSWIVVEALARDLRDDPTIDGIVVYTRDVTERRQREQTLERYAGLIDAIGDPVYELDAQGRFTFVNEAFIEYTGYDEAELLGEHVSIGLNEDAIARTEAEIGQLLHDPEGTATLEYEVTTKDGERIPVENRITLLTDDDGRIRGSAGVVRDISDRKRRERELQSRVRQQELITELGRQALDEHEPDALMANAAELVAETLDNEYCGVLDLDASAGRLLLRQGVGWDEGIVGEATISSVADNSQAAYTLAHEGPVVVADLTSESRFSGPGLLTSHDVKSGISVVIGSEGEPWGILGTHDTTAKTFSEHDVNFVQSVANVLATAINRHHNEQAIREQREALATLNNLNRIVSDITETVIAKSTREEIEQSVCEALAATGSYEFAWIGEGDLASEVVEPRVTVGTAGYLDDAEILLDPDDDRGEGPTGRALRTGEVQTTNDSREDARYGPWQELAAEYGFRSSAAIPIVHEETTYGVLNVYADRPNAFESAERRVISRLGEVVGHAIASVERKRALMSEEAVELTFQIRDAFTELDVAADPEGTISFDAVVPVKDDAFLVYGTVTADARETLTALYDRLPSWERVTFHAEEGASTFELRAVDPPVLSVLTSFGGSFEEGAIEDGDLRMQVHLSPSADVRRFIETVQESYPGMEMVTRQQVTRTADRGRPAANVLDESLTDSQRTALEAAFHAGFFEWPRDSSGEEVADSLDIAAPTFHNHLRKAERKLVASVLGAER
ncbi:MAG: histidine kinase [Halobacteriales archaeon SW_8_66_22]|nr:MAG: histidine kinase [Halobacteriales archaeon SW_8_66_22]